MNDYETMLVFRPDIEDEKREALIERLKSVSAKAANSQLTIGD